MLSLPGYSFPDHFRRTHRRAMPDLVRPTRREVAAYYSAYPKAVGISSEVFTNVHAQRVRQLPQGGFELRVNHRSSPGGNKTMTIICKHLVLATGIYSHVIPPPPIFAPLLHGPNACYTATPTAAPLLVVGSGFTAADVMMAAKKASRKICHIYKWNLAHPSPLKGCHSQAYPEYAQIYRRMKAVVAAPATSSPKSTPPPADDNYEGFPNARVVSASNDGRIRILTADGDIVERVVEGLKYCVGRRGSLEYLSSELRKAVGVVDAGWISGDTMRWRVEDDLEIAKGMFVVGSLTGDSLVRFGFGGCAYAAGKISGKRVERSGSRGGTRDEGERGVDAADTIRRPSCMIT